MIRAFSIRFHCMNLLEYGFSPTRTFPYKDRIFNSVLIRESVLIRGYTGQRKPVFGIFYVVFS